MLVSRIRLFNVGSITASRSSRSPAGSTAGRCARRLNWFSHRHPPRHPAGGVRRLACRYGSPSLARLGQPDRLTSPPWLRSSRSTHRPFARGITDEAQRSLGPTRTRTRLADRLSLDPCPARVQDAAAPPRVLTFSAWCHAASSGPRNAVIRTRERRISLPSRCHLAVSHAACRLAEPQATAV